jgi:hypothetical protein
VIGGSVIVGDVMVVGDSELALAELSLPPPLVAAAMIATTMTTAMTPPTMKRPRFPFDGCGSVGVGSVGVAVPVSSGWACSPLISDRGTPVAAVRPSNVAGALAVALGVGVVVSAAGGSASLSRSPHWPQKG